MKDFIGKTTFGFLMAQLFPGAVAMLGVSFLYFQATQREPDTLLGAIRLTTANWSQLTTVSQLFLAGSCVGLGMLIHGLHWGVIGYYECRGDKKSVFDSFWHKKPLFVQVLAGPIKVITEAGWFFGIRDIRKATVGENSISVDKELFPNFEFLQDFYLHPAQFFAHTSFALLVWIAGIVAFVATNGLTQRRLTFFVLTYLLCGLFFVLGRLQLRSLFANEEELVNRSQWKSVEA
jgi:hypothetical protein